MSSKNERAVVVTSIVKDTATLIIYRHEANEEVWWCGGVFHDIGEQWSVYDQTWLACYKRLMRAKRRFDQKDNQDVPF